MGAGAVRAASATAAFNGDSTWCPLRLSPTCTPAPARRRRRRRRRQGRRLDKQECYQDVARATRDGPRMHEPPSNASTCPTCGRIVAFNWKYVHRPQTRVVEGSPRCRARFVCRAGVEATVRETDPCAAPETAATAAARCRRRRGRRRAVAAVVSWHRPGAV